MFSRRFLHTLAIGLLATPIVFGSAPVRADDSYEYSPSFSPLSVPRHLSGSIAAGIYDPTRGELNFPSLTVLGIAGISSFLLFRFADDGAATPNDGATLYSPSWLTSKIGNFLPYAAPVGFFAVGQIMGRNNHHRSYTLETAEHLAEALVLTFGTTTALKFTVQRERPNGKDSLSFPSQHTSLMFSTAGVIANRYPWYVGAPSLAIATAVGLTRVDLDMHHLSDVAFGAGLGIFYATAVKYYHTKFHHGRKEPNAGEFFPIASDNTYGLNWQTKF